MNWDDPPVAKSKPGGGSWDAVPVASPSQLRAERDAAKRSANTPGIVRGISNGLLAGFSDELDAAGANLETKVTNLVHKAKGEPIPYTSQEAGDAVLQSERAAQQQFSTDHPYQNFAAQLVGGAALPGGKFVQGAGKAGATARAAMVGAGYGAAYGAGAADGDIADRAKGAAVGGVTGAAVGAGAQKVISTAAPVVRRGVQAVRDRISGGDPAAQAATRVANLVDPAEAEAARAAMAERGVEPKLSDVAGERFRREMRTMGRTPGDASDALVANSRQSVANMKPAAIGEASRLSPYQGTTEDLTAALDHLERNLGQHYSAPYAEPVTMTPEAMQALRGEPGQEAIKRAIGDAAYNQDYDRMAELQTLQNADLDKPPTLSSGALDRVRIAMREMGRNFTRGDQPNMSRAAGASKRVEGIDTALDATPGMTEARTAARTIYGAQEAATGRVPSIFNTDPRDYQRYLDGLTPEARAALQVRTRQEIQDQLGGQRASTTGTLDTLSSAQYARENVPALFGEEGQRYLNNIESRLQQVGNDRFMSPNSGAQTSLRDAEDGAAKAAEIVGVGTDALRGAHGDVGAMARLFDRFRTVGVRQPEKDEFVRLGLTRLGTPEDLTRVLNIAQQARQMGRNPPKVVRDYVTRAKGVLGAANPLVGQLEQKLLANPSGVAADQQN